MTIKSRLLIILAVMALLSTGAIAVHFYGLLYMHDDARIINLAGNLRFRSYKLALLAGEYLQDDGQKQARLREEIEREVSTVDEILSGLRGGSDKLRINREIDDAPSLAQFSIVEMKWKSFRGHILDATKGPTGGSSPEAIREESYQLVPEIDRLVNLLAAHFTGGVNTEIKQELVLFLLTLALLALILRVCKKGIFAPLREATEFAAGIAGHDFQNKLEAPSVADTRGEVGILVETLDDMANRLKDLYGSLEMKVQERTEELYATYEELYASQTELQTHVAELSKLNAQLQDTRDALINSEKLAGIGTLAAGVAHEINNPLAAIIGFAEGMMRDIRLNRGNDEQRLKSLERICDAGWRCARIVAALKSYARDDSFDMQPNDLNQLIDTALSLVTAQLRQGGIDVSVKLGQDMPEVECDEHKMQQIVINLVMNAKDAMPSGGSIAIRSRLDGDMAIMEVEDTGTGIPPEIQAKIFDPFFTTKEVGKGTGLGLSICQGILEKHHGHISAESEEGRGTKVTVAIPVKSRASQASASSSTDEPPSKGGRYAD